MIDPNLSVLSICAKAGAVASGEFACAKSVRAGKAYLVLVSEDASANTKKKFRNMCAYYQVPFGEISDMETLGHLIGRGKRSCLAMENEGLAKSFAKRNGLSMNIEGGNAEGPAAQ